MFHALMSQLAHTAVQEREAAVDGGRVLEARVLVHIITSQNGFYLLPPPESVCGERGEGRGGRGERQREGGREGGREREC
jgi:hypothetical protein